MNIKDLAIQIAMEELGKPYELGAQGPDKWDCSGFIIEILKYCRLFPKNVDETAQNLYLRYRDRAVSKPYRGCVAFFGSSLPKITHCVLCVSPEVIIGANGKPKERAVTLEPIDYRIRKYNLTDLVAICDPFKTKEI